MSSVIVISSSDKRKPYYNTNKETFNARRRELYQINKEKINTRRRELYKLKKSQILVKTPVEVVKTPVEVVKTPVEVVKTPVEVVKKPVEVVKTPVEVEEKTVIKKLSSYQKHLVVPELHSICRWLFRNVCDDFNVINRNYTQNKKIVDDILMSALLQPMIDFYLKENFNGSATLLNLLNRPDIDLTVRITHMLKYYFE